MVTIGFWPQVTFGWLLLPAPIPGRLPWPGVVDQWHQGHHLGRWNGQRCGRCWGSFGEASGAQGRICFYFLRFGGGGWGGGRRGESLKLAFYVFVFCCHTEKRNILFSCILMVDRFQDSVCLKTGLVSMSWACSEDLGNLGFKVCCCWRMTVFVHLEMTLCDGLLKTPLLICSLFSSC